MGFIKCGQGHRHEFYSINPHSAHFSGESVSLFNLLSSTHNTVTNPRTGKPLKLSRKDRKALAVKLSTAVLQMYSTPWIGKNWSKRDIIFQCLNETAPTLLSVQGPYLLQQFDTGGKYPSANVTVSETQEIIFRLGVLLLELCIGEALEDQLQNQNSQDSDIKDIVACNSATVYDWWERSAMGEEGPEVANAIGKCLRFEFHSESRSLHYEEFRNAVYNEVVQPHIESSRIFNM